MTASPVDLREVLRRCIQCGLCLPHCATYLATGNEVDSPRGRLILLAGLEDADGALRAESLGAFERCLGCHACETACPGGIPPELLAGAREVALEVVSKPLLRASGWLDSARRLGLLRRVAAPLRRASQAIAGRTPRLLGSVPVAPSSDRRLRRMLDRMQAGSPRPVPSPWQPEAGPTIAFFGGCANEGLLPGAARRTRRLLEAAGCRVEVPAGQACCGALAAHLGNDRRRRSLHECNLAAFAAAPADHIVVEAAGCGLELKDYPPAFAAKVLDAVVLLSRLQLPPPRPMSLRVVVHDPCHALHGQGIEAEARVLLRRIPGVVILPTPEAEVCCGSAGAWSLRHPGLSAVIGRRKAALLAETGAQLVVTTNPGCLGQIAEGLARLDAGVPILPLTDLLYYAHLAP